jgi:predicted MFS family arabinose efflux permease
MKQQYRPLLAGTVLLTFAVALLLFLNYAKFGSTLESRERARHALLAEHLAKTFDARLALGLDLESTPNLQAMLNRELAYDPRLHAIAALDMQGGVRIVGGSGQPGLWQATREALQQGRSMPVQNDAAGLAVALHNGFGGEAGWLVLEYDLRGTHAQVREAFAAVWPVALFSLLAAIAALAVVAPLMHDLTPRAEHESGRTTRRISVLIVVLLLLVHCLIAWSAYRAFTRVSSEDAPRLADTLAHTLTPGLETALDHGIPVAKLRGVDEWLQPALAAGPEFAALSIEDANGHRLFEVSDARDQAADRARDAAGSQARDPARNQTHRLSDNESAYRFALQQHGQTVATLVVTLDLAPLAERRRQLAIEFATLLAISVLISMEVLHGMLTRTVTGDADRALARLRLPLFLFFAGSELPRAFLPMWAKQLALQPLPQSWSGTVLATVFAPLGHLPEAVRTTLPISLFLFTIALISPLAGRYTARYGPIRLLQFGLLLALLGNVLALLSESLASLCLARVLAGASSGFITVACFDYIGRSGARARGMALYLSAYVAAGICGAGLGALLVDRAGTAAVFAIGIGCTLLASVTLWGMPTLDQPGREPAPLIHALGHLLRQPRFLRLIVLIGLPMQILQQGLLFYWAPLALSAQGEPTSFVGLTMMAYFFLVLLLNAPAAQWADRSGRHTLIVLTGLAIAGAAGIFSGALYTSSAIALAVALIGVVWAAGFPAQGALVLKLGDGELSSVPSTVTVGVYRMIERIGAMLAAPLIALLIGWLGYANTAKLIGVALLSCASIQAWMLRQEKAK